MVDGIIPKWEQACLMRILSLKTEVFKTKKNHLLLLFEFMIVDNLCRPGDKNVRHISSNFSNLIVLVSQVERHFLIFLHVLKT